MAKKDLTLFVEEELNIMFRLNEEAKLYNGGTNLFKRAKGSILHDFYNSIERIFELISKDIDDTTINLNGNWHKRLLYQMTIEIKNIRPVVISKELASELDEYLSFRHVFRSIYGFELEGKRLDNLINRLPEILNKFNSEIKTFLSIL
ncbi:MAG: hypothetical protein FJW69_00055 [Actinobacteria bacterium]|nr:hypothetical protein [Actinomycetota bacterium]MBM3712243.1 hypothetical protein [Actinomycetota bacterium]